MTARLPMAVDRNTDDAIDRLLAGISWDCRHHTSTRTPWWWSARTENLSNAACALLLASVLALLVLCLAVGQRWQAERCAQAATTATPCGTQR